MSEQAQPNLRPPTGFIVEGDDEFNCYPSLVARITGALGVAFPVVNAGGYGNILDNIGRYLDDLVMLHHPLSVIVTVDLRDPVKDRICESCRELRAHLESEIEAWQEIAERRSYLSPLPERIVVVIQVQSFETWVAADVCSLQRFGYVRGSVRQHLEVDEIANPYVYLCRCMRRASRKTIKDLKHPATAKAIVGCLQPQVMKRYSRSFEKFHREVTGSYALWCSACASPPEP